MTTLERIKRLDLLAICSAPLSMMAAGHRARDQSVFGTWDSAGGVGTTINGAFLKLRRRPLGTSAINVSCFALSGSSSCWMRLAYSPSLIAWVRTPSSRDTIILAPCARPIAAI